ncbi:uncharacterized protein EI90DRAFT_3217775 [Cantharellus anzutake]|uniref:uncharacterized protein n=1 Tax=Cantharellus anzutake TaxID=1750568 RepID=UPI0019080F91|nr:uncharacterized protein EI90DRAFT_3217775 [Cantharellus anzutake]KAF8328056.1 hypothetical protein EI90DRAFT_3217775 [Cantharellus anzutake]
MYWLDGRDLPPDDSASGGEEYWETPERDEVIEKARNAIGVLADNLKAAVVFSDRTRWWISACEYIDAAIGIVHREALWSYRDEGVGYNTCKDVFEWLDAIYAEWTSIPMVRLYELARERYLKSLPTDLIVPLAFATFRPSLSPLPLDLVADDEPESDKKNKVLSGLLPPQVASTNHTPV